MASHRRRKCRKGIEMTKRGNYALVVLSLNLPNPEDSMDFLRAMRKNPRTRTTPSLPQ